MSYLHFCRRLLLFYCVPNINIPQSLVNTANELSHDSGKKYNIENVREFYGDVCELIKQIKDTIWTEENDL